MIWPVLRLVSCIPTAHKCVCVHARVRTHVGLYKHLSIFGSLYTTLLSVHADELGYW
jgi:hypothetical protein